MEHTMLFAADLHLGDRMYGLKDREEDFYSAASVVFDKANYHAVDAVVLAGDIFDISRPQAKAVATLKDGVDTCNAPVFGIEGNHDRVGTGEWLYVCGVTPLGQQDYDSSLGVYGIDYLKPSLLLEKLEEVALMCENENLRIPVLVLHCGFAEMGDPFAAELTFENVMPFLKRMKTHTVLVGHIHQHMRKDVEYDGHRVTFLQPGSTEVGSLNEEKDKKVFLVQFNDAELMACEDIPIPTRKFNEIRIDTKEDYAKFLGDFDNDKDIQYSMNIVRVRNDIDGAIAGIEQSMKKIGALVRLIPYGDEFTVEEIDRDNQIVSLESVVEDYFEKGTDVYELLLEMLHNPEKTSEIAETFMNNEQQKKQS